MPPPLFTKAMFAYSFLGGLISCILICIMVFSAETKAEWPEYWRIRPIVVVTLAGAAGGAFYYLMSPVRALSPWSWVGANFICLVVYTFLLWMGTVIGCAGTLWN